MKHHFSSS